MASTSDTMEEEMDNEETVQPASSETEECIFPGYSDVNEFSQKCLRAVLQSTRSSNDLPVGDDYDFYSTYRTVRDVMDIEGRRVLALLQRLLRYQGVKGNFSQGSSAELEDQFDTVMDANDQILERVGTSLDEASGIRKEETKLVIASTVTPNSSPMTSWNKKSVGGKSKPAAMYRLLTARNIHRPQVRFKDKIDNRNTPFKPSLRHKPHALRPLEESLRLPEGVTLEEAELPIFVHPHPYLFELEQFSPEPSRLQRVTPQEPPPVGLTPLMMVETSQQLDQLVDHLRTQTEIAVDLEHHSYRSFQGFTCLMQISTRTHDYIVDTLELRADIHKLNEIFTDPKITKVFHGADSDVVWLQRDFGVYIVNMFDTGQAARVLGLSRFSLAHLMLNYCRLEVDKQFQLADWRIRPLPSELVNYAREDTHYLLYIYDMMHNQLIDRGNEQCNLLLSVYDRSKNVAAKVFQKPIFTEDDFYELYRKSKKVFNSQQLAALRDLFSWRDKMARVEDESFGYVLPNHMMLQIAEILPRERQGVLACCNPIPPLVRQSLQEIHNIVLQAREVAIHKVEKLPGSQPMMIQHPKYDAESLLNCPHDMTHQDKNLARIEEEITASGIVAGKLPTLGDRLDIAMKPIPSVTAFAEQNWKQMSKVLSKRLSIDVRALFVSPFRKYFPGQDHGLKPVDGDIWKLKPPTSLKRKAEQSDGKVDLDTFLPEFAPPTKRSRAAENVSSSSLYQTSGNLFKVPESTPGVLNPTGSAQVSGAGTGVSAESKKKKTEWEVEKQIRSLRQELAAKKTKEKRKRKEKKEALKLLSATDRQDHLEGSEPLKMPGVQGEEGKEKKRKKTVSPSTPSSGPTVDSPSLSVSASPQESTEKKKKKKKKKKLSIEDAKKDFSSYDYSAAEKTLLKAKTKKDTDVFNPALPARNSEKDGAKKPKLSGPKSNKSVSFGSGTPGAKSKKKR